MTDIVERLRPLTMDSDREIFAALREAADEIERLRKELKRAAGSKPMPYGKKQ